MNTIIKKFISYFSMGATLIFICSSIFIAVSFGTNFHISLRYVWGVLLTALLSTIVYIPLFASGKELSKYQMFAARLFYYVYVNAIVITTGWFLGWFDFSNNKTIFAVAILVLVIYAAEESLCYIQDQQTAQKLNNQIKKRRHTEASN